MESFEGHEKGCGCKGCLIALAHKMYAELESRSDAPRPEGKGSGHHHDDGTGGV